MIHVQIKNLKKQKDLKGYFLPSLSLHAKSKKVILKERNCPSAFFAKNINEG